MLHLTNRRLSQASREKSVASMAEHVVQTTLKTFNLSKGSWWLHAGSPGLGPAEQMDIEQAMREVEKRAPSHIKRENIQTRAYAFVPRRRRGFRGFDGNNPTTRQRVYLDAYRERCKRAVVGQAYIRGCFVAAKTAFYRCMTSPVMSPNMGGYLEMPAILQVMAANIMGFLIEASDHIEKSVDRGMPAMIALTLMVEHQEQKFKKMEAAFHAHMDLEGIVATMPDYRAEDLDDKLKAAGFVDPYALEDEPENKPVRN